MVVWENRYLQLVGASLTGLVPDHERVPIPRTDPGGSAKIAVWFTAPKYPGGYKSYWKMVDEGGRYLLPWLKGIWVRVNVVDHAGPRR